MVMGELKIQKNEEYLKYINEHINNVKKAYAEIKNKVHILWVINAIKILDDNGAIDKHDDSKYSDEEFFAYRAKFYPIDGEDNIEDIADDFNKAWKHHYTSNNHHWEFWLHNDIAYDMSDDAILHMVSDWQGMSYKFGNNAKIWYEKQTDIIISEETKRKTEELLMELCK